MNLLLRMRTIKDLTPSERHVVDYIFKHLHDVIDIGIVELANKTFTSTSTVKRLCHKLGIESYIEFRAKFSADLAAYLKESIYKEATLPVEKHDSMQEIIKKVSYYNAKSIIDSKDINKPETFDEIVKLMIEAEGLDFYGFGPSNIVAKDAALKCLRLGVNASAYDNRLEMFIKAKTSTSNNLAILISYTGETSDMIELAEVLNFQNASTVSLTGLTDNQLMKICKYNLFVDSSEPKDRLGAMYSRTSTLNVIDILFTAFINTNYEEYMQKIHQTYVPK